MLVLKYLIVGQGGASCTIPEGSFSKRLGVTPEPLGVVALLVISLSC
jgi:hypothetical protein